MATAPDSSVLSEIALELSHVGSGGRLGQSSMVSMATRITPTRALAPYHVIADFPLDQPFIVRGLEDDPAVAVTVTVAVRDPKADLAVLVLASELPRSSVEELPLVESPPPPNRWMSFVRVPGMREPQVITGALMGVEPVDGIPHLRLEVHDRLATSAGISGAPVIVNGALAGIVARASSDGAIWHALIVTRDVVARLEASVSSATVVDQAPFDAHSFVRSLSPSSSMAMRHADGMRRWNRQARVHMEHLIMALFLKADGPAERLFGAHGIGNHEALRTVLATAAEMRLPNAGGYAVKDDLPELPPVSRHVQEALAHAEAVARRLGSEQVQSRHLLYGALSVSECSVVKALLGRGINRDGIDLTTGRMEPGGGGTPIIGADSDAPSGVDRLGLEQEIATLAALIATRDTNTPMSIGLFGNWGSGKSFFMQKMDEQIRQFRDVAAVDPDSPYCPNIAQLWFNAWHYIDKSLWASLGAEIFEGLAHALTETETKKEGRAQLDDARTDLLIRREAAELERKRAQEQLDDTRNRLAAHNATIDSIRAQTDREVEASLGTPALVSEVLNVAATQPAVKGALDEASRKLGRDEINAQSKEAEEQVKEILAIGSMWHFLGKSIRDGGSARWWIAAAIAAGVAVLAVPLFPIAVTWLRTPAQRLLSALVAFSALVAPALRVARRVTAVVSQARDALKARIEEQRQRRLEQAEQARAPVLQQEAADVTAVNASTSKVKEIDEQIARLRPARQFIDFIRQRHQSDAYTQHFGVIARARQDFEELTRLMKLMRDAPRDAESAADGIRPVERIVLYIDDLDRCPEDKVFEVLQAVHLLLAFPLFVVVVGVDPRWLLHSLRANLTAFADQSADNRDEDDDERMRWQSTPLDYLEKIFQIPFTLRPMGDTGYEQLIDQLTTPRQPTSHAAPGRENGRTAVEPSPGDKGASPQTEGAGANAPALTPAPTVPTEGVAPQVVVGAEPAPSKPNDAAAQPQPRAVVEHAIQTHQRLTLAAWESAYMKLLFPLIPSPRATKRFVNVYRLLRGVLPNSERTLLIGNEKQGGYRAVLLLLAMVTGYPVEATLLIRELLERVRKNGGTEKWWAAIDAIREIYGADPPSPKRSRPSSQKRRLAQEPKAPDPSDEEDGDRWAELFESLDQVRKVAGGDVTAGTMARWAPVVARYSFASGRLLVADRRPENRTDVVP